MVKIFKGKISRIGLYLVFIYILLSAISIALGMLITEDNKGSFVLLQLPIVFQHALLVELGLIQYLDGMSWSEAYLYLGIPMMFFLYLVGLVVEKIDSD